jgi:tetratricopeptide (TPR) repeat protein
MLRRLVPCAWAMLLGTTLGAAAQDRTAAPDPQTQTALKFLEALRERGYADLAIDYAEQLGQAPDTPRDLKAILDYEEARSILAETAGMADLVRKVQQLEKAREKLASFTKAQPNHRLAPAALVDMARLLYERGVTAVLQVNDLKGQAEKQVKYNEARSSFNEARAAYDRAEVPLKKAFDSYPRYIDEGDPRRAERDEAHRALMNAELQRTLVDYEVAETYAADSKERSDHLNKALTAFENVFNRYRTQLAGLFARMMQAKCYEEQGKLTEAMGIYKELMEHKDPALREMQRKIAYFQIIIDGKRGEHVLAVTQADNWLKANPNAIRSEEGIGVRLELAKNILAQIPDLSESDRELALRRSGDMLSEVVRYASPYKSEALKLMQKYKLKAGGPTTAVANLKFDEALAQAESAVSTHEWDRAIALLRQAVKAADPNKEIDKANRARYLMAYCCYESQRYYESDVLAEHIARNYPKFGMAAKAAEIGIAALTYAYSTNYTRIDRAGDLDRLLALCRYTAEAWPDSEQADAALFTMGEIAMGRGDYSGGAKAFESIRQGSPKRLDALVKAGDAHWFQSLELRNKGKEKEADAQSKTAETTLETALKSRREANVPPTDQGLVVNTKALAEIYRVTGRPKDALALLAPVAQALSSMKPLPPELADQLRAILSMQLRAHIANGEADQAISDMKALETLGGASLTQLYLELGLTLQKELEAEKKKAYTTNLIKTQQAYTHFLEALAASKTGQTYESLMFAASALLGMDKGKEASAIIERILNDKEIMKTIGPGAGPTGIARDIRVHRAEAEALRKENRFDVAQTVVDALKSKYGKDVSVLFEQGYLYQDWAKADRSKANTAIGYWRRLSTQLERARSLKKEYYESLYQLALTLKEQDRASEAAQTLKSVLILSPTVGNQPEMKAKYQKLLDELKL